MMIELEQRRHAHERGSILLVLKEDYGREMTSVRLLVDSLDTINVTLSPEGLSFHLQALADQGYIQIWRARNMPGWRTDRRAAVWQKPDSIVFAKLLPRGLQLIDGLIPQDPLVSF